MYNFSGMSIVRANAVTIFDEVFQDDDADPTTCNASSDAYLSSIIIGIFRTISSLILARSLRHYRRRFMYFVSAFATITALLGFATCDYLIDNESIYNSKTNSMRNNNIQFSTCNVIITLVLLCL